MPEEVEVTTPPEADNSAETDPKEGVSKGIKERLDRLERNVTKRIEETELKPLQAKLDAILKRAEAAGIKLDDIQVAEVATEAQAQVEEAPKPNVEFLRLQAAYKAGLPQEVLPLITASDEAEITAQVAAIKSLNPGGRRLRSPVPAPVNGETAQPTFTRSQLRDGKFFIENKAAIMKAMREGRIEED